MTVPVDPGDDRVPGCAIEASGLSKRYGSKLVVDDLSFTVLPGKVTGFLGPNGSGKSTTMRLIVGLDHPGSGTARIGGVRYADLRRPLRVVGTLLDSEAVHPGRSAYRHLLYLAQTQGIPAYRIEEVIELVGLRAAMRERAGTFSLGMRKRLGIAAALMGDPRVLILDEPINGLDPDGIYWMRNLLKGLAAEGRTVFVSSHLMSEMAMTADNLVVIDHGRLIAECTTADFISRSSHATVVVRSSAARELAARVAVEGGRTEAGGSEMFTARGISARRIGELADVLGIVIYELTPVAGTLEDAFRTLTHAADQTASQPIIAPVAATV